MRARGEYYRLLTVGKADANGEPVEEYGGDECKVFLVRLSLLEMSIFELLSEFLGRGVFVDRNGDEGNTPTLAACESSGDCSSVLYCDAGSLAAPMCAGGSCVCGSQSRSHPALDGALSAAKNVGLNIFGVSRYNRGGAVHGVVLVQLCRHEGVQRHRGLAGRVRYGPRGGIRAGVQRVRTVYEEDHGEGEGVLMYLGDKNSPGLRDFSGENWSVEECTAEGGRAVS